MKMVVICFARKGSQRLKNKNMKLLNGKPMIWYTLQAMRQIYKTLKIGCYVLTDDKECLKLCKKNNIATIWRDHPEEWDDIRLNKWAHQKIKADGYILLQATSRHFFQYKKIDVPKIAYNYIIL